MDVVLDVPRKTNRLEAETSPYLRQHAGNPVDWYPWGEEALERARREGKPIFLSIGYSACHWCHVMAHESFEDEAIAAFLNAHFVSIKVDREERPDLDEVYMSALQLIAGNGGWPMSVFLTPDLKPFHAGTYFPPHDLHGMTGFDTVLRAVAEAWEQRRDALLSGAERITDAVRQLSAQGTSSGAKCGPPLFAAAEAHLERSFDAAHGGFGGAPKFPPSFAIQYLLRRSTGREREGLLEIAERTLTAMAHGGIFDHLGGGFHRYSVDERWLVPHFEKMLYDNAQLAETYLEAYQRTRNPLYRRVAVETLEYLLRDMRDPAGGFYSSEDADSEGEEGKFYLWTRGEIAAVLGEQTAALFCEYYGVAEDGNFVSREEYHAGQNIPHVAEPIERVADRNHLTVNSLDGLLAKSRAALLAARSERARPGLDRKIVTAWNALAITALAKAARVLDSERYRAAAEQAADFLLEHSRRDGALLRSVCDGKGGVAACLDDYAFLANALIDLYETTFDTRRLDAAESLAREMLERFHDPEHGSFFLADKARGDLIARSKPWLDGVEPSGNTMAAAVLQRLGRLSDNAERLEVAEETAARVATVAQHAPQALFKMLCLLDSMHAPSSEVVIVAPGGSEDAAAMLRELHRRFLPRTLVLFLDSDRPDTDALAKHFPIFQGKTLVAGKAAAYLCENRTCRAPVTAASELAALLDERETKVG